MALLASTNLNSGSRAMTAKGTGKSFMKSRDRFWRPWIGGYFPFMVLPYIIGLNHSQWQETVLTIMKDMGLSFTIKVAYDGLTVPL